MNGPIDAYPFNKQIPAGDDKHRYVCGDCGWIHYTNPKVIVGAICTWEDRYLLCRRAIEPRKGYWTMPAGFLEDHESTEDGARREIFEESQAIVTIDALLALYSIARISQVHVIYRATLTQPKFGPGPESLEVQLFTWEEIPWEELAFPNVHWALHHHRESRDLKTFQPFAAPSGPWSIPTPTSSVTVGPVIQSSG